MYSKKPVISGHSKEDQKLVFKADYRLMQVKVLQNTSESYNVHGVLRNFRENLHIYMRSFMKIKPLGNG